MMTETPDSLHVDNSDETRASDPERRSLLSDDESGAGWQPTPVRWAWWMMVSALAVAGTLLVINWVGWENLPIAARLIVLVELFLVACLVLFLVLGERFSEWAGYGSLWTGDEETRANSRESISRSERNWSRTAQLKQYLRRTYYEVKCQQSTVIPKEWRRSQPAMTSPRIERQGQNPPARREPAAIRGTAMNVPPVQSAPRPQPSVAPAVLDMPLPSQRPPVEPSSSEISVLEAPQAPAMPTTPRTCRLTSRLEIRRRQ